MSAGLSAHSFVYEGADNTLAGASIVNDVTFGMCARSSYRTQIPDLQSCADYTICDLCPGGEDPCEL